MRIISSDEFIDSLPYMASGGKTGIVSVGGVMGLVSTIDIRPHPPLAKKEKALSDIYGE